jgi:2,5-diketo-D-gluconate reductase B
MDTETIPIRSLNVPKVGFGTYKLTGSSGAKSIEDALRIGYRHIDTAQMYENEEEVGKAIKASGIDRDKIFITTKVWPSHFKTLVHHVEDSLKKLGTGHVDLLLLHWPSDEQANKTGLHHLNEALHKGYTKSIGVSNFTVPQLTQAVSQAPLVCNQLEYHPFLSQQKEIRFLKSHQMFLTAYRPLAMGEVAKNTTLQDIAAAYKKTPSQVALRWLVQQGDIAVIPKASSTERITENLDIFDFELSAEDMERIFALEKDKRMTDPGWAPKWD